MFCSEVHWAIQTETLHFKRKQKLSAEYQEELCDRVTYWLWNSLPEQVLETKSLRTFRSWWTKSTGNTRSPSCFGRAKNCFFIFIIRDNNLLLCTGDIAVGRDEVSRCYCNSNSIKNLLTLRNENFCKLFNETKAPALQVKRVFS